MDLYLAIVSHPLLWVFIGLTVAFFLIQWAVSLKVASAHDPARWLRGNYVAVILTLVGLLAIGALTFYLLEIGISVAALVDRLRNASADPATNARDIRNLAYAVGVLIGVLAASATIFFSVIKVWINERTATATETGLITDRINKAVEALGAEKTVSQVWRNVTYRLGDETHTLFETQGEPLSPPQGATGIERGAWQVSNKTAANLEMRIGAIYALERIAQDSDRDHVQIMEILCAYIRENAPLSLAKGYPADWFTDPETGEPRVEHQPPEMIRDWARALPPPRTDIQTALTVIGRRTPRQIALEERIVNGKRERYRLDLRNTCLQGADLTKAHLAHADLSGARMQGADLWQARMQGAILGAARMQGADLWGARMQGAYLWAARMQGANLRAARMQGVHLIEARFDAATSLREARLKGAALRNMDLTGMALHEGQLDMVFGDDTVTPPAGMTLPDWFSKAYADYGEFLHAWLAWQKDIGFDPEDPAPRDA